MSDTAEEKVKAFAKTWLDANVWDGEDRSGCIDDWARFDPEELQALFDDFIEDAFRREE